MCEVFVESWGMPFVERSAAVSASIPHGSWPRLPGRPSGVAPHGTTTDSDEAKTWHQRVAVNRIHINARTLTNRVSMRCSVIDFPASAAVCAISLFR